MSDTPRNLIVTQMRTAYGHDVIVYYDPETTLTLVYDYVPGRSLVFEGRLVNDFFPEDDKETLVGCFVDNHILGEMSINDIWVSMQTAHQSKLKD